MPWGDTDELKPNENKLRARTYESQTSTETESDLLPADFYTGQLQENSYCYLAHSKMAEVCGMASHRDRSHLATLLTNCHLEAANRNTIQWHPEHALRYASKEEYSLVNRYIPIIADICSKTGNGHHLVLFRMQFHNDKKLWDSLGDLEATVERAAEVNLESQRLTKLFEAATTDTLLKSEETLSLIKEMQSAGLSLAGKHKELEQMHEKVVLAAETYADEKRELQAFLRNFSVQTKRQVEGIGEKLRTQKDYDELFTDFTNMEKEVQKLSRQGSARCPQVGDGSTLDNIKQFFDVPYMWHSMWIGAVKGVVWNSVSAPFRMFRLLEALDSSGVLSRRARLVVIGAQATISFGSAWIVFKLLLLLKSLIENGNDIRNLIADCLAFLKIIPPLAWFFDKTRGVGAAAIPVPVSNNRAREKDTERMVRKVTSRLEQRMSSSIHRALQELSLDAFLAVKMEEIGQSSEQRLLSSITRVEMRQIHVYQALQDIIRKNTQTLPIEENEVAVSEADLASPAAALQNHSSRNASDSCIPSSARHHGQGNPNATKRRAHGRSVRGGLSTSRTTATGQGKKAVRTEKSPVK